MKNFVNFLKDYCLEFVFCVCLLIIIICCKVFAFDPGSVEIDSDTLQEILNDDNKYTNVKVISGDSSSLTDVSDYALNVLHGFVSQYIVGGSREIADLCSDLIQEGIYDFIEFVDGQFTLSPEGQELIRSKASSFYHQRGFNTEVGRIGQWIPIETADFYYTNSSVFSQISGDYLGVYVTNIDKSPHTAFAIRGFSDKVFYVENASSGAYWGTRITLSSSSQVYNVPQYRFNGYGSAGNQTYLRVRNTGSYDGLVTAMNDFFNTDATPGATSFNGNLYLNNNPIYTSIPSRNAFQRDYNKLIDDTYNYYHNLSPDTNTDPFINPGNYTNISYNYNYDDIPYFGNTTVNGFDLPVVSPIEFNYNNTDMENEFLEQASNSIPSFFIVALSIPLIFLILGVLFL